MKFTIRIFKSHYIATQPTFYCFVEFINGHLHFVFLNVSMVTFGHSRLEDINKKNVSPLLLYNSFHESNDLIQQNVLNPQISNRETIDGFPNASCCKC